MKKLAIGVISPCLLALATLQVAGESNHAERPFKVTITIDTYSLKRDFYKKTHIFYAKTEVANASTKDQTIVVWTQYGWNWTSDNAKILPGKEALQNLSTKKTLRPGEKYSSSVELFDSSLSPAKRFRLGFLADPPIGGVPASTSLSSSKNDSSITWSNEVALPR